MTKRIVSVLLVAVVVCALLAGCGSAPAANTAKAPEVIKIAGTGVSEVFYEAMKEKFEAKGYKTEFIAFDSNPVCLEACASGETNVSLGQQVKFAYSKKAAHGLSHGRFVVISGNDSDRPV